MTATVQIRKKGQFTIPIEIREILDIQEDETVTVSLLGDKAFIVTPQKLKLTESLKKTAAMAKKEGITLDEMLAELDEIRHQS